MYLYFKILLDKLSLKDLFSIRTGKKILNHKYTNHQIFLEKLYIDLEKSYGRYDTKYLNYFLFKHIDTNLFFSQFFSKDFNSFRFTKVILISLARNKKICLPIPPFWFDIFEKKGLKLSKIGCYSLFLLQGLFKILVCFKVIINLIIYFISNLTIKKKNYDNMLFNLSLNNFSLDKSYKDFSLYSEFINKKIIEKESINLIYCKNSILQKKIQQNIKKRELNVQFSNFDFPFTISASNLVLLIIITILIFFISLINIFRNKVEFVNFSEEILKYYILKLSNIKFLPKNIYFNNSSWKYKPLWTYIAEKKGLNIVVYFYSLSEMEYKNNFDYKILQGHYSLCWNNYFSWNKEHSNYLKQISKVKPKIIEKKPFSLRDTDPSILNNFDFSNTIAIFDSAPYKKIFSDTFAMYSSEYRCYQNILSFLNDIDYLSDKYNLKIIYKTKKSDKRQISKYFLSYLKKLTVNPKFILIDDSISPKNYINKCLCSISYPFTSTAHFNEDKSKSIYYDPTGNIYLDDIAAHGINVINDKNKLDSFLYDIIFK